MAQIINSASVLAIKEESTEGTLIAPTAAGDFIALQDDADMSPQFDQLDNAELKNSIGKAKGIVGAENPTFSGSHYLRHSGTSGTAPGYGMILEGAFGTVASEGTEYTTTSGSTVSSIAQTSAAANWQRGHIALIQDGTNGYSLRPVHSLSTNAWVPGFNVTAAPATGINLGKPVTYYPANSGHKSYSIWHYLGNGGAIQAMSGAKFTEISMSFSAGELINMSYTAEGLGYYFNPIMVTASTKYLDFTDDDGTFAAVIPPGNYKDPHEFAAAVTTAMNTASSGETHTCTYSSSAGTYTILCTGTVLTLLWNTGTNTANTIATKLGFTAAANSSGTVATTGYTGTASTFTASYTPAYDASNPLAAKYHELLIGDATDTTPVPASNVSFTLTNTRAVIGSVSAQSGRSGSLITSREAMLTATALLDKYEAKRFYKYQTNEDTRAFYAFGTRSGSNWVKGKCGGIYLPTATISEFDLSNQDGQVALTITLKSYVNDSSEGEVYLGFV